MLAAIGLVVPQILHIAIFLSPLAAVGILFLMIGAGITHARLKHAQTLIVNGLLLVVAGLVAVMRFGPYQF